MAKKNTTTAKVENAQIENVKNEVTQIEKSFEEQMAELNQMFGITDIPIIKDRTLGEIFTKWLEKNPKITPLLNREQLAIMSNFYRENKDMFVSGSLDGLEVKALLDLIDIVYKIFEVEKEDENLSISEIITIFNYLIPQIQKSFRSKLFNQN